MKRTGLHFPAGLASLFSYPYLGVGAGSLSLKRPRLPELVESTGLLFGFPAGPAGHVQTACRGSQMRFEETVRKS